MSTGIPLPYWLTDGTERCEACEQTHVLEMACRCWACDAGLCIHCVVVVRATGARMCRACAEEEEG